MGDEYGEIVNVATTNIGEYLTVDAPIGTSVLTVTDATTFDEKGGQLQLNGLVYSYTGIDIAQNLVILRSSTGLLLTLGSGLSVEAFADDRVEIYPARPETKALVDFGVEDGEAVYAIVPHDLKAVISDGFREEGYREPVLIEERGTGELYVKDLAAIQPQLSVEVTLGDGVPPIASPTPVVSGWVGALHAKWAAILDSEMPTYEVHISTVSDFIPDATTLVGSTSGTSFTIRSLPNDLLLAYDTTYYVKIVATDSDGAAPAGSQGSAQLQPVTGPDISANFVYAGTVSAPQIEGGELSADLVLTGSLKTALTGGRTEIIGNQINIYDPAGQPGTTLAPDSSVFRGDAEIGGLTVTDAMSIRGTDNELSVGAELDLAAGITAPSTGPSVVQDWDSIIFTKTGDATFNAANITSIQWLVDKWICGYRDGSTYRVYRFNSDGTYHSDGAAPIVSSTALQTTMLGADGICYTVASNNTVLRHRQFFGYVYDFTEDFAASIPIGSWPTQTGGVSWSSGRAKLTADAELSTDYDFDVNGHNFAAKVTRESGTDGQDFFMTLWDDVGNDEIAQIKLTNTDIEYRVFEPGTGSIQFHSTQTYNPTTHAYWMIKEVPSGAGGDFYFYTSTDGNTWTERWSFDHDWSDAEIDAARLSFLGQEEGGAGTQVVYVDDVKVGPNNDSFGETFSTNNSDDDVMTIGNDGTNILLAEHDNIGNDRLHVRVLDPDDLSLISTYTSADETDYDGPLAGILIGSFDFGASRYVSKRAAGSTADWRVVGTTNGASRILTEEFPPVGGVKGIAWDGTNFWELSATGRIYKHTTGLLAGAYLAGSTWYDSAGTTHETTISPLSAFTLKRRARITITAGQIPGGGGAEDPNSVRFYVGTSSGALKLQSTTGAGVNSAIYQSITTGGTAPPASNNFAAGVPAKINFGTGYLSGDGSFLGSPTAIELGNAIDLNTITTPGIYSQSSSTEAAAGTNYPPLAPYAGILEVYANPGTAAVRMQRYSAYRNSDVNPSSNVWERTWDSVGWGPWIPLHYDTGWITTPLSSIAVASGSNTLTAGSVRRVGKTVHFTLDFTFGAALGVTDLTGNVVDTNIATMALPWRPGGSSPDQGGLTNYNGSQTLVCQIEASGLIIAVTSAGTQDYSIGSANSVGGSYVLE